jgi:hypothetical protein
MHKVNIHKRQSFEAFYPLDALVNDAGRNAEGKATVMHGLRILSAPDVDGTVCVARANHHVSEDASNSDSIFRYPFRADDNAWFDKAEPDAAKAIHMKSSPDDVQDLYRDFIDGVIEAARTAHFLPPIGRGEGRLRGFHGG